MGRAAMNMARIPMMMVCLRMHMEEWNHEHPEGYPREDHYPRPCCVAINQSHCEVSLAQFLYPINQPIAFLFTAQARKEICPRLGEGREKLKASPALNYRNTDQTVYYLFGCGV